MLLEHEFDRVLFAAESTGGCHNPANKDQEWEATELAAELLLPYDAAHPAARARRSDEQVADDFEVSVQLAGWRMNATGARLVAGRALAKRTGRSLGRRGRSGPRRGLSWSEIR
ncbi:ImmA/IrrE family metallo-endopeptidase [Actinoplanes sp. NPDC051633]|uniref:ImmA/IrrE family metallo-endopeptidase n=1 Tax=Actinoplanes sp. NPDC051633 TaxID=3155670 RepID=UPI003418E467